MGKEMRALFTSFLIVVTAATGSAVAASPQDKHQRGEEKYRAHLEKEVRHQLVMLPWYSVFDNLAFRVDRDKVTLMGQVTRPTLKSDAEGVVKKIEGVADAAGLEAAVKILLEHSDLGRTRAARCRGLFLEWLLPAQGHAGADRRALA